jgi:hypothetical protein
MHSSLQNIANKRFGKLIVIKLLPERYNGNAIWECNCDCGQTTKSTTADLKRGRKKSCGCNTRKGCGRILDRQKALCKKFYKKSIVKRSKKLGMQYDLDLESFIKLIKSECFYCGKQPNHAFKDRISNAVLICNGIDRVNNNMGYLKSNVVTCCYTCNMAKGTRNFQDYINWTKESYNHMVCRGLINE